MKDRVCLDCENFAWAVINGKESKARGVCTVPFDLSQAPANICRLYIIPPGTLADKCPHWNKKPVVEEVP